MEINVDDKADGLLHTLFQAGDPNFTSKIVESRNAQKVEQAYRTLAAGDIEQFGALPADDISFDVSGSKANPFAGKTQGRAQVIETPAKNFALVENQCPIIETVVAQGDTVVVIGNEQGTARPPARPIMPIGSSYSPSKTME